LGQLGLNQLNEDIAIPIMNILEILGQINIAGWVLIQA